MTINADSPIQIHRGTHGDIGAITIASPLARPDLDAVVHRYAGPHARSQRFDHRILLAKRWKLWAVLATGEWAWRNHARHRPPPGEPVDLPTAPLVLSVSSVPSVP